MGSQRVRHNWATFTSPCITWLPKYCSFSFSNRSFQWRFRTDSLRIDWLDILAAQKTLKSLLQHHNSKASILQSSAFFYGPILKFVHDYWKNHSFDYMDLCWQSDVSAFSYAVQVCHSFSSKEQVSFIFMAAVIICSDFSAQENKVCHCFHCFPIYLPWSDGTRCHDFHVLNVEF